MNEIIIYGAGYPDIVKLIHAINRVKPVWRIKGFIDDTFEKQGMSFMGYTVLGDRNYLAQVNHNMFYINNVCSTTRARGIVTDILKQNKCKLATLVHPNVDTEFTEIGEGTIIADGVILGGNVRIGRHCAVRYNSVINHDNVLEDNVFVGPGVNLSRHTRLKTGCYLGVGSVVKERITIGEYSIVAAGAVVTEDVPAHTTVIGVPARVKDKGVYANN